MSEYFCVIWVVVFPVMELYSSLLKVCHSINRRWLLVVVVVAITHIMFQSLLLPYGTALRSLLPNSNETVYDESSLRIIHSSAKSVTVRNPLTVDTSSLSNNSMIGRVVSDADDLSGGEQIGHGGGPELNARNEESGDSSEEEDMDNFVELEVDRNVDPEDVADGKEIFATETVVDTQENDSDLKLVSQSKLDPDFEKDVKSNNGILTGTVENKDLALKPLPLKPELVPSPTIITYSKANQSSFVGSDIPKSDLASSKMESSLMTKPGRKKMKYDMPPKSITSIDEMNNILLRRLRSSGSMRPRWASVRDREILAAKTQIENAPIVVNDQDLYAPLFRNVSKFKRSYELMERTLKVYMYKDGKKPVFHVPIMKGLYASEGWFMKLMQRSKRFLVKDPKRAHLFYMPFSSRMLEYHVYVRNSHDRTNLRQFLKEYQEKIASKYPFWNRTDGADHFLVACHDWAPYETRHHMENCIKALCNADVTVGFKIGRDVSLPETYVRSARNPLRDLGGEPPSRRNILAFYAGSMHGYLRPILLDHWKDKHEDMEIFGPMPPGVASKMNYIHHMKRSKYCICPRGYEVNSPRVVESIFYECVPVIISDNFIPPLFEVLDWSAFSVILAEKDIPNLRDILLSIPKQKYLDLQLGVKKVQRHFLWHGNPVKYDLFHMTLHSIWHNRVYQIKPR